MKVGHMRSLLFVLLLGAVSGVRADAGFAGLKQGLHAVGFRVVQQYDHTRTYKGAIDIVSGTPSAGERARPIQTLVWYPAQQGGAPLSYEDYARTEASDDEFGRGDAQVAAYMAGRMKDLVARVGLAQAKATLGQRMWAMRGAHPKAGKYPVVVYAPGGGGPAHEVADLAEYLASNGYIVIASRNLGTRTRGMNYDAEGADSQAGDIGFLISYAQSLPQADMARIAVAGWSWGGMANVFAASRDSRIAALVSFDGTREPELTRRISPSRVALPWLYVQRHPETVAQLSAKEIETSVSLLNELKYANIYQVVMYPMLHEDFSSAALRLARPSWFAEYSRAEVEQAYHWTARYTLEFLNAYLKGEPAGLAFLDRTPLANGMAPHMARVSHTPAQAGLPPNRAGFAAALAQQGFGEAPRIYREMKQRDPAFVLSENELNVWGYQLMAREKGLADALAIFRFGTGLYPDSAELFDSLGEALENNQDAPAAIASYRRALELNPRHVHAVARMAALGASAGAPASPGGR
jgi:tetratricopeptide (TPR) repeat protein